jgi:hypothetical protein
VDTTPWARDLRPEKYLPLEIHVDVPMVIDICSSIPQGCPQKLNHKETILCHQYLREIFLENVKVNAATGFAKARKNAKER